MLRFSTRRPNLRVLNRNMELNSTWTGVCQNCSAAFRNPLRSSNECNDWTAATLQLFDISKCPFFSSAVHYPNEWWNIMRVPSPTTTAENILFIGWKVPVYPKCFVVTSISTLEPGFPVNVKNHCIVHSTLNRPGEDSSSSGTLGGFLAQPQLQGTFLL